MKKLFIASVMALALTFGASVKAQEKIGLVDIQKALNEVEEGKSAKAKLKAECDQKQKSLDALQNDL